MYFNNFILFFIFSEILRGPERGPKGGPERGPEGGGGGGGSKFCLHPSRKQQHTRYGKIICPGTLINNSISPWIERYLPFVYRYGIRWYGIHSVHWLYNKYFTERTISKILVRF